VKVWDAESSVPSQPADTFEDGQSRNPRSRLEKLNGKGTRTDQHPALVGPQHRSTEVPAANRGHRSSRSTRFFRGTQLCAAPTFPLFAAQQHSSTQHRSKAASSFFAAPQFLTTEYFHRALQNRLQRSRSPSSFGVCAKIATCRVSPAPSGSITLHTSGLWRFGHRLGRTNLSGPRSFAPSRDPGHLTAPEDTWLLGPEGLWKSRRRAPKIGLWGRAVRSPGHVKCQRSQLRSTQKAASSSASK